MSSPSPSTIADSGDICRGPILRVLRDLLSDGRQKEIVALVDKLLSRNVELGAPGQAAQGSDPKK